MPPKQQQQNALQRDAEGLALLEKRLLDLEAGLARREAEVEAAEREIGAAQKRAREQDEAEKEAKRPRGGEELPGEGGVPLMPAELMPGLPRARAEEIFLAFDEQDPGFWAGLGPTLQRELGSLEDEREVLALLDGAAVAGQDVGDDDDDDDFAFLDPERWRTMQPTAANMRGFEDAVRRLYRFKGNQQLQDRRDDVTERVRDLVRLRRGESGPPKRMWILRLGGLFHSYEEQNAEYETRDPSAALVMRDVLRVELLPERVRQARRRFTAQFKAAPKGGFAAWERRVAVFEGGATSKKTTAQRASIVASLTRFTAVAGLQAAPPALRIKAFATAMLGKGMTQEQLEAYVARVPGQRGRPRTGEMRTASVGKYVEVLGAKLGVPSGDLAAMKKAILKARLERREVPAHAPPITLEQQRTLVEGLVRGGDEQVTVAACLAWAGALRMADLRALAPTDVVIVGPGLLRVSWWTTKEASLRMRESEVTYRVPLGVALRVSRWVQRGARFTEATTRKLLREARKLFPVCAEHSWKRGALQHLARSGAGWEDLLLMARHQSKDTLKRYLWGCLTPDSVRTARASLLLHTPDLKSSHPLRDWANSRHPGAAGYLDRLLAWGESRLRGDMGEQSEADFDRAVTLEDWLLRGDVSTHVEGVRAQEEALSELASRTYTKAPSPVYRTSRGPIDTMPVTKADYGKVERGLWEDEIRVLRQLTREPMLLSHERHHAPPSSDITEADLAVMLQSGVVRRVEKRPRITLKVFKIPKKGKEETRLLIDGRPFDSRTSQPLSPITPSLRDVEGFVLDHAWFATLDLLGYFYQLPVSDALADYLGFRAANAYYVFRIAVPGIARAPAIAQLTTLGVRRLAGIGSRSLAIYDDIAYGGWTRSDVVRDERSLRAVLADTRIQIREDKAQGPSQVGTFNGLDLDLATKTIAIPREWAAVCRANKPQRVTSFRALAQRIGCLRWALYVMRSPAAAYPGLLRASRLVSGRCLTYRDWDTLVELPQELLAELEAGDRWLGDASPRRVRRPARRVHVWTDASDQGGGVVVLDPTRRTVLARESWRWKDRLARLAPPTPIRRRELVTAILGVLLARHVTTGWVTLDVFHDNSTAESRHRKLASPHPAENRLIVEMQERLRDADVLTHLVPGENMVADLDTRD
ncbi:putative enzymatic polyprotein [Diplonema papillatum]|nr:putative enzymatic polyprotein [Diplonema papillatum]